MDGTCHATFANQLIMKKAPAVHSIDDYIAQFPEEVQARLEEIRALIRNEVPEAEEAMKYQIPTFVWHGNLVHFAAFKNHIGLYPTSSGIEAFQEELSKYTIGKGSIQFPLEKPIPLGLIRKIVRFRVKETRNKLENKTKKK